MKLPVVVGVDGSEPSLRAAEWAAEEAVLHGLPLRAVYASLWEHYEGSALAPELGEDAEKVRAEDIVDCAARRALRRCPGLDVTTLVVPDEAERALVHESRNACALIVGSRGRSGLAEALLGSVGMAVAAHADCPVVLVRGRHDNQAVRGRVVVGVGDGAEETAVVGFAAREARSRGVPLVAVRAWRRPAHEPVGHPLLVGGPALARESQAAEALESALAEVPPDVDLRRRTVEGPARRVLASASYDADLLVVGLRRHAGRYGLQLGRVAQAVLHHSACPVAVVPHL
ncbi:universal stress protein [Streptomyces sp. enrichment culture]|uniref:universal stress protein n=1 Tax=Streptomyces sp. enrichment culture TaxID=1795815 RepID=UPI003F574D1A